MPFSAVGSGFLKVGLAIGNSLAPSTWVEYKAAWNSWCAYLDTIGQASTLISEHLLLSFLERLMLQGYSYSHILKQLAGISFFAKLLGFPSCMSFFSVKQVLKGYRKSSVTPDSRLPISVDILKKLCISTKTVCFSIYEALLFQLAFSLFFFGAFRISELLPNNVKGCSGISFSDLVLGSDFITIRIKRSKTDQLGLGRWVTLRPLNSSPICPILLIHQYLTVRPVGPGCLLIHCSGLPLTRYQFCSVLKKCLIHLGLGHLPITSHSFRIGAATTASELGLSADVVKNIGGWRSSCYRSYIRPNFSV